MTLWLVTCPICGSVLNGRASPTDRELEDELVHVFQLGLDGMVEHWKAWRAARIAAHLAAEHS